MKKYIVVLLLGSLILIQNSCKSSDQIEIPKVTKDIEIQDFIWQGMNLFYLWQESVPNLEDSKIKNVKSYVNFLKENPNQKDFFESLIYKRQTIDRWSWIVDDYIELENSFAGVSKSNGVDFGLGRISNSNNLFGYVRLILPDSDASNKDIERGDLFLTVNGQQLTIDNYRELLFGEIVSYTLGMASIENGQIGLNGETVELNKFEYTENPVFLKKIIEEDGHRIGYLMYNSFTADFDNTLNDAFLFFKNEGVTDLILDVRYNLGGSVSTAVSLASMITGQFKGELFTKEQWNSKLQKELQKSNPDWLVNNFSDRLSNGVQINSLNLNSLHMIVTGSSASASELIINGLIPYIPVTLIGSQTEGKYTASVTLYDSDNFGRKGANPNHLYAMQPIVLEELNKLGENDKDGFDPNILLKEDLENMGEIGDDSEPLLRAAINDILGIAQKSLHKNVLEYKNISNSRIQTVLKNNMYIDKKEVIKMFKKKTIDFK